MVIGKAWAGVDLGKGFHWAHVMDGSARLCSRAESRTKGRTSLGSSARRHMTQAVIALARRRVNVLWAMLRDGATFETRSEA